MERPGTRPIGPRLETTRVQTTWMELVGALADAFGRDEAAVATVVALSEAGRIRTRDGARWHVS